jgi:hypothetical protein
MNVVALNRTVHLEAARPVTYLLMFYIRTYFVLTTLIHIQAKVKNYNCKPVS